METYLLSISLARHRQIVPSRLSDQGRELSDPDVVMHRPIQEIAHEVDDAIFAARRLTDGNNGA
jgi:hypothetical protein